MRLWNYLFILSFGISLVFAQDNTKASNFTTEFIALIQKHNEKPQLETYQKLESMGKNIPQVLETLTQHPEHFTIIFDLLLQNKQHLANHHDQIKSLLQTSNIEQIAKTLELLCEMGTKAQATTEVLQLLKHEDHMVRVYAVYTLGEISSSETSPQIFPFLTSEEQIWQHYRWVAARSIARLGILEENIASLRKFLMTSDLNSKIYILIALGETKNSSLAPDFIKVLQQEENFQNSNLIYLAIKYLGDLGSAAKDALPILEKLSTITPWKAVGIEAQKSIVGAKQIITEKAPPGWPQDLWEKCFQLEWVDFTNPSWTKLSIEKQIELSQSYRAWYAKKQNLPLEKKVTIDPISISVVFIPPGRYFMYQPRHKNWQRIVINKSFWCSKYEITQQQWQAVTQTTPWIWSEYYNNNNQNAVSHVSRRDIETLFLSKLGAEWSLPTRAQWNYMHRAGTTKQYSWGDKPEFAKEYAWIGFISSEKGPIEEGCHSYPVGQKKPNAWNIYDTNGNVCEWTRDFDGVDNSAVNQDFIQCDKVNPYDSEGNSGLICGTSWGFAPENKDSLILNYSGYHDSALGFRICSNIVEEEKKLGGTVQHFLDGYLNWKQPTSWQKKQVSPEFKLFTPVDSPSNISGKIQLRGTNIYKLDWKVTVSQILQRHIASSQNPCKIVEEKQFSNDKISKQYLHLKAGDQESISFYWHVQYGYVVIANLQGNSQFVQQQKKNFLEFGKSFSYKQ